MISRSTLGLTLVAVLGMAACGDEPQDQTADAAAPDAANPDAALDAPIDAPPDAATDAAIDGPNVALRLVVAPATLTLTERTTSQLTVALSAAPTAAVTVAITSADASRLAPSPALVVFDAATWATPQVVTVNALDDVDTVTNTVTLSLAAPGLPAVAVATTILDDDDLTIITTAAQVAVVEGESATFQVRLSAPPPANLAIAIGSADAAVATVSPTVATFTPATWNVPQTVTIVAPQDADALAGATTVSLTAPGLASRAVAVAVTDDDAVAIVASAASLAIAEGATQPLRVRLSAQPAATVTLTVVSSDVTVATVAPAMLTFTPATWSTEQVIAVAGVDDPDLADESAAITIRGAALVPVIVAAHVDDDDVQTLVVTPVARTVREGTYSTITVALSHPPQGAVDVAVVSSDLGVVRVSPSTLSFRPQTYAIPQTVVLLAQVDANSVDNTATVTLSTPTATAVPVTVRVADSQTAAILLSRSELAFAERRGGQVGVRLSAQPTAAVTVAVTSPDVGAATVSPATLSFTAANWADYQLITVLGTDDADVANEQVALTLSAPGWASAQLAVTVVDDDVPGLVVSRRSAALVERATPTATATVVLSAPPAATITVAVSSSDPGAVAVAPATLTFTPATWSTAQTVTLTAMPDADLASESATVDLVAPGVAAAAIAVTVDDDTQPAVVVTTRRFALFEGTFAVVGVRLSEAPAADVIVTVASSDPAVGTTPTSLVFTPANWNNPVNLRLNAVDDANQVHEEVDVTLASAGWAAAVVHVAVHDDDAP